MFRYFPLIAKNAMRNRRRSILTICSVGASLCLLGVLMAIYHAFFFTPPTPEQARRLVTRNRISLANSMPIAYRDKIARIAGVRGVMVQQWFGGVYKEPKNMFARFGIEPERFFTIMPEIKVSPEEQKAFISDRAGCIIGRGIANKFNLKVGDRMTLVGDIFPVTLDFNIRGIFDFTEADDVMYFNVQYLFEGLSARRRDSAGTFTILMDSPDDAGRISREIDDMFHNAPDQTRTESEKAFQLGFISMMGNVKMFLLSICAAVTFTIILVSANTMAMSVRERIREVGVLKTLGFTQGEILGIVLGEAAFLSFIGGLLGYALAMLLTLIIRQAPAFFAELKTLTIVPPVAAMLLAGAVLIGIVSSIIPAWHASRTNIIDSLRYSG
jgi:putative ABC transport system permease protein